MIWTAKPAKGSGVNQQGSVSGREGIVGDMAGLGRRSRYRVLCSRGHGKSLPPKPNEPLTPPSRYREACRSMKRRATAQRFLGLSIVIFGPSGLGAIKHLSFPARNRDPRDPEPHVFPAPIHWNSSAVHAPAARAGNGIVPGTSKTCIEPLRNLNLIPARNTCLIQKRIKTEPDIP